MAAAISVSRFVQELEKLHQEMMGGTMKSGEYDQRLAKTIQELRDRGVAGDRADITKALDDVLVAEPARPERDFDATNCRSYGTEPSYPRLGLQRQGYSAFDSSYRL